MGKGMALTVAVAILRGGEFPPDKDEMRWALPSADAALDACCFEELVTALGDMTTRFERCLVENGIDEEYANIATKEAPAVLAKVKDASAPGGLRGWAFQGVGP